ncbi:MAG: hypothetical protein LBM39_02075 [Candidatus Methanoplasma sp.]|jgi:flagellar biosynthesis GTPase FlhF|nr:hypothetical protein [Candidatus Methanoplasma sp.]
MNFKKLVMVIAVLAIFAVPLTALTADTSDAYIEIDANRDLYGSGFTNSGNGTLYVPLSSDEGTDTAITVIVSYKDSGEEITRETFPVPAKTKTFVAELSFGVHSVGDHELKVVCEPSLYFPGINESTVTITVNATLWSQWTTFAAIGLVVVVILILVYIRMRSAPAKKADVSFTELERNRLSGGAAETAEPERRSSSSTERRRYNASSESAKAESKKPEPKKAESKKSEPKKEEKKPEPKPEPQEKKVESFTELEKQKSEKKAVREKESETGEPKKLKYVSSRRK